MENKFVNPYTFIGLSDKCNKQDNSLRETNELLSGFITYKINTKSPLFIPNTSSDKAFEYKNDIELDGKNEHKLFDFFSYENLKKDEIYDEVFFKPIIPGSEIRGVIRNIYETLTNSCLSSYDSETIVKRTREQFKAGLIGKDKNGMFYLISADDCIYRESSDFTFKTFLETRFKEGQEVHFDLVERGENVKPLAENVSDTKIGNQCAGYIIKGEDGPEMKKKENEKHNAHIFKRKKIDMKYALNDNDMGRFIYVLESYKNQPNCEDSYKEYIANFKKFKDKVQEDSKEVFFPVYFSKVVNNIYLSPACFTKEAYKNDLEIILNKYGEYNYCKNKKKLCDACNLFGMILDEGAIASKIRFSDAVPKEKDDNSFYYDKIVTLNNLSNPKPSNSEFYLKKPTSDSCFWTYDYYIEEKNGKTKTMIPEIMGRKFYWHHNKFNLPKNIPKTNLNKTVRPVKSGVEFEGKVYFDGISKKELDEIIWILNSGGKEETYYKFGGGKPLGLGSVSLKVNNVKLRKINFDSSTMYNVEEYKEYENPNFDKNAEEAFLIVCNYASTKDLEVRYPSTKEQVNENIEEGFKWFENNHKCIKKSPNRRTQMRIEQVLPSILKDKNFLEKN